MPWLETDAMSQRIRFVRLVMGEGVSVREASRRFGVSAKTGHKWLARFRASFEVACLADRSRRPHQSPEQIDSEVEQRIVALRQRHGWGGRKLQTLLAREGVAVSARTVDRVIRRQGLTRLRAVMGRAVRRFERAQPNELWQIDFKGQYWLEPRGALFPLSVLDDHSRYAVSLTSLPGTAGTPVWQALELSFDEYGLPDAVQELRPFERAVVHRGRQTEPMFDQRALAGRVALVHRADLRHGDMRLVDDQQEVIREEVEQRVRRRTGCAVVEMPRIVLHA